jgi:hypothetical protein
MEESDHARNADIITLWERDVDGPSPHQNSPELLDGYQSIVESEPPVRLQPTPLNLKVDYRHVSVSESDREFSILNFTGTPPNVNDALEAPVHNDTTVQANTAKPSMAIPSSYGSQSSPGFIVTQHDIQAAVTTAIQAQLAERDCNNKPIKASRVDTLLRLLRRGLEAERKATDLDNALRKLRRRVKKLDNVRY